MSLQQLLKITCSTFKEGGNLEEIYEKIQEEGWVSKKVIERKNMRLSDLLKDKSKDIIDVCLNNLNMKDAIYPETDNFDGILLLGTTFSGMDRRCQFYESLIEEGKIKNDVKVYILSGDRKASADLFGESKEIFEKFILDNTGKKITLKEQECPQNELEMMQFILKYRPLSSGKPTFIYSEKDPTHSRATTDSTMVTFLDHVKHEGKFLAISNQPFIKYQNAVLSLRVKKQGRNDIHIFTAGNNITGELGRMVDNDNLAAVLLDTVGKTIKCMVEMNHHTLLF